MEQVTAPASPDPIAPRALVLPVERGLKESINVNSPVVAGVTSPIRRTVSVLWVGNAVKCQPSGLSLDDFKPLASIKDLESGRVATRVAPADRPL